MSDVQAIPLQCPTSPLGRPRLGPDVLLRPPVSGEGTWLLQRGTRAYFALAPDFAKLAGVLDGVRNHQELVEILGPPWSARDVAIGVERLANAGMLDDGRRTPRRESAIRFVPPLTLQLTVFNPMRAMAYLQPLVRLFANRWGAAAGIMTIVCGVVAMIAQAGAARAALGQPLPLGAYAAIGLGVLVTTALHELGHGAVLAYHGGSPRRMGVMLFYLSPAFFCDVSDGWRLPRKGQRVQVALAGIAVHVFIASISAALAWIVADSTARTGLLVFAVAVFTAGLFNLIPFVKLDGYIALMCQVDVPRLRDRAMGDARRFLARLLFGGLYVRELPRHRWAVPFGLACMTFPIYLVFNAMALWSDVFQRMGVVGATLTSFALCYLVYHLLRGFGRVVQEGRRARVRLLRIVPVYLLALTPVVILLSCVRVPLTVSGGYVVRDGGRLDVVLPASAHRDMIPPLAPVRLFRAGLLQGEQVGAVHVADLPAEPTVAPLSAFLPIRGDGIAVPAVRLPLIPPDAGAAVLIGTSKTMAKPATGVAVIDVGRVRLGAWLWLTYIAPAFRW